MDGDKLSQLFKLSQVADVRHCATMQLQNHGVQDER